MLIYGEKQEMYAFIDFSPIYGSTKSMLSLPRPIAFSMNGGIRKAACLLFFECRGSPEKELPVA